MSQPEVLVVGLSHRTAPLPVREKLSVREAELERALREALEAGATEAMIVSTCNRVELYAVAPPQSLPVLRGLFQRRAPDQRLEPHLYDRAGLDAVRHIFRVAASLDSMVVGEPQILGQVKDAFGAATTAGTVGSLLGRCMARAFGVAKRVRTDTAISEGTVSVSTVAIQLARKIFGNLGGRNVVLVGAGTMGEEAAKVLVGAGAKLTVTNRSAPRGAELAARVGGESRSWEELPSLLVAADVTICSTSAPGFVVTRATMDQVVRGRRHRPLFVIDIAVPRDVDPAVGKLDNVFLYDVDDLQKVASENLEARAREQATAEHMVETEVRQFAEWRRSQKVQPTIVALRSRVLAIAHGELSKTGGKLRELGPEERKALEIMVEAIANKVLHPMLTEIKRASADEAEPTDVVTAIRRMFALQDESTDESACAVEPDAPPRPSSPRPSSPPPSSPPPSSPPPSSPPPSSPPPPAAPERKAQQG